MCIRSRLHLRGFTEHLYFPLYLINTRGYRGNEWSIFSRSQSQCCTVYLFSHLQASGGVRSDPQLLQDGQAALPHWCVRAPVWGGAGVLGTGQQPGQWCHELSMLTKYMPNTKLGIFLFGKCVDNWIDLVWYQWRVKVFKSYHLYQSQGLLTENRGSNQVELFFSWFYL